MAKIMQIDPKMDSHDLCDLDFWPRKAKMYTGLL